MNRHLAAAEFNNQTYAHLPADDHEAEDGVSTPDARESPESAVPTATFSWFGYWAFVWMGMYMLWSWNMVLASAPYFKQRFASNSWIQRNFQSAILTVFCATNLLVTSTLSRQKHQRHDAYPRRVRWSLYINLVTFTLLAFSTILFSDVSVKSYFGFILAMSFLTGLAAGFVQNGLFSYVSSYGHPRYIQGAMAGQAVAGIVPCIVQIISVTAVPSTEEGNDLGESPRSAFAFFSTAIFIGIVALLLFAHLTRYHAPFTSLSPSLDDSDDQPEELRHDVKPVPLTVLLVKLRFLAGALFLTYVVTMLGLPVFTPVIESVRTPKQNEASTLPRILEPAAFVPLALLFWNSGDLLGRILPLSRHLNLTRHPTVLLGISVLRFLSIPLYASCNVDNRGSFINSDAFYLAVVQSLCGISNGYLSASSMIAATQWVDSDECEAAGSFMSLILVFGLTVGSLLSFGIEP